MNYFAIGRLGAAGGVQVTASHNPAQYNGLKFSRHEARPVSGDHGIPLLERTVASGDLPVSSHRGTVRAADVFADYRRHVRSFLRRPADARKLRVVVDAANGMATMDLPLFEILGVELVPLYFELDGTFPNHEANPLKLENLRDLQKKVVEVGADLGVACDGDFDRAAFVDERGEPVGSDLATALIAGELLSREPGQHVLYDLRSSRAVAEYVAEKGGIPVRERVGHSFMKATLREKHGLFGGELAGHYYFRDNYYADCAILAVVEILNLLWHSGKPMSEVVAPLLRYAKSPETNFEVEDKARQDEGARGRLPGRPHRLARRHHRPVRRLVVQRPAVEHRAAPPPGRRGAHSRRARAPLRRAGRPDRPARPPLRAAAATTSRCRSRPPGSTSRRASCRARGRSGWR